jgi:2,3-dihydroxyphenylpropionate 1,2-dioxygenase
LLVEHVLGDGLDVRVAYAKRVNHGFAEPLEVLFQYVAARPTIHIFINAAKA